MTPQERTTAGVCACGKVGWLNRRQAEDILVRAKIAFALYGNRRRREQRVYECPARRGTWHLTSQPAHVRGGALVSPDYPRDDLEAAREYISGAIFHADAQAWEALLAPDRADQTLRALGLMHQASLLEGGRRRNDPEQQANYQEWLKDTDRMRGLLVARIRDARQAVKRANVLATESNAKQERSYYYALARRLTLEIAEHRKTQASQPSDADRRLWAVLDELYLPRGEMPIGELVASGRWYWAPIEHPLDGDLGSKPARRVEGEQS